MDIIYYHGGCPDGWCAAYIASLKYPEAKLVPLSYGAVDYDRMLEEVRDKHVLMLDFSLKTAAQCDGIYYAAESFHIYDHHKSAEKIIGGMGYATFDMERSGAGLTWDYLFGKNSKFVEINEKDLLDYKLEYVHSHSYFAVERPWWVNYTEDQDLWRFKLPFSRDINAWLNVQERTAERWSQVAATEKSTVINLGGAISMYIRYMVSGALKDTQEGVWEFEGRNYRTAVVNNGHIGTSEIGEALYYLGYEVAMMWREDGHGMIRFGLRSDKVDVGSMAASFPGGGGHKASSGFEMNVEDGRKLIDRILGRNANATSHCCR